MVVGSRFGHFSLYCAGPARATRVLSFIIGAHRRVNIVLCTIDNIRLLRGFITVTFASTGTKKFQILNGGDGVSRILYLFSCICKYGIFHFTQKNIYKI